MRSNLITMLSRCMAVGGLASSLCQASIITSVTGPVSGTGTVNGVISGSNVTVTENITGFSPTDGFAVVLNVTAPPSTATVYNFTKTITNNTGLTWLNYQVGFGCDAATGPRGTVDCYSSGLSSKLDANANITSSSGSVVQANGVYFDVNNLNIAPGQTLTLNFNWDTCPRCFGGQIMWQYANVAGTATPEPATSFLIGCGLIAVPIVMRRRKGKSTQS